MIRLSFKCTETFNKEGKGLKVYREDKTHTWIEELYQGGYIAFLGGLADKFAIGKTPKEAFEKLKYRNAFLGENTAETRKKIDSGEYKLVNLN